MKMSLNDRCSTSKMFMFREINGMFVIPIFLSMHVTVQTTSSHSPIYNYFDLKSHLKSNWQTLLDIPVYGDMETNGQCQKAELLLYSHY